jgi:hypothetical protein
VTIYDTVRLVAQAREYADHRDNPKRGQPPGQSELFRTLAAALEAADAEVEKAYAAMTHWLGKANDADNALAGAYAALADIADGRWDEKRTDPSQSPSDWVRELARRALASSGVDT